MKKLLLIITAIPSCYFAQVGINTTAPKATLDVITKTPTGTSTTPDGLLIPRVDRQRAQSMSGVVTSTLIYVNDVSTGSQANTAANIDTLGYYYFNGTAWIKLNDGSNTSPSSNIYTADGTLAGNRVVTQADKKLSFTASSTDAFNVATNTLSVDAANKRVGVGTASPQINLDVTANNPTGTSTAPEGFLIPRVDRQRAQSMQGVTTSTLIYVNDLSTGTQNDTAINIDAAAYYYFNGTAWVKLLDGSTTPNNIYNVDGTLAGNRIVSQADKKLSFTASSRDAFNVAASTVSVDAANKRVGIGTTMPTAKLDLQGNQYINAPVTVAQSKDAININIGQDGLAYGNRSNNFGIKMTSNSSADGGNISRINFGDTSTTSSSGIRYLSFSVGKTLNELMYLTDANTGRVGIGTITPSAKLDLQGNQFINATITNATSKDALNINIGQDGYTYGNRTDNYGIKMISSSGSNGGNISRINFGDAATSTAGGTRYLSFSVGKDLNEIMYLTDANSGRIGVGTTSPTEKLHVIGNILASGTVTPSDIRIKKDIVNNQYGLSQILQLRTINYRYKDEALGKDKKIGFIAQEVKAIIPEIVTTANDENKTLGVNYAEMTVVLSKAIQEQQAQIEDLKTQIKELKNR